jgi:hypothetical protein
MVDKAALQAWAQGKTSGGMAPEDEGDGAEDMETSLEDDALDEEGDEEPGTGDRETLWAGEEEGDLTLAVTPERAQAFCDWLKENEPIIHEVVLEFAGAVADADLDMIEHAREEMGWVEQKLTPDYPELTEAQRAAISGNLEEEMANASNPAADTPEWAVAVTLALARARQES